MNLHRYIFQSERLGFRAWKTSDFEAFAKMNADEKVMEYFPNSLTSEETKGLMHKLISHYEKNGYTYFAIEVLETQEFIGMIGLAYQEYKTVYTPAVDIGWRLKKSAWGKGYATEGARRCLAYAFEELGIEKVISVCTVNNVKSENVMKKIGMKKVGSFKHPNVIGQPAYEDHFCYEVHKR